MKQEREIKDENEIRNKLKYLQGLQKERKLAVTSAKNYSPCLSKFIEDIYEYI